MLRAFYRIKKIKGKEYICYVKSVREGDRVRQVLIKHLGRADKLKEKLLKK